MYIKTDEKKIWAKKNFWTPLSEKTGARNRKKRKKWPKPFLSNQTMFFR